MDTAEYAAKTNSYIQDCIKFADAKAGSILTLVTLEGSATGFAAAKILPEAQSFSCIFRCLLYLSGATVLLSSLYAVWYCIDALSPKTPIASGSLNSFPDIADIATEEYVQSVDDLKQNGIASQYSKHNSTLSILCNDKYRNITCALTALRVSIFSAFVFIACYATQSLFGSAIHNP